MAGQESEEELRKQAKNMSEVGANKGIPVDRAEVARFMAMMRSKSRQEMARHYRSQFEEKDDSKFGIAEFYRRGEPVKTKRQERSEK